MEEQKTEKNDKVAKFLKLIVAVIFGYGICAGIDFTKEKNMVDVTDAVKVILEDGSEVYAVIVKKKDEPKVEEIKAE